MEAILDGKKVIIKIGDETYRISESIDHKLVINKTNIEGDALCVFPRYANEIEVK